MDSALPYQEEKSLFLNFKSLPKMLINFKYSITVYRDDKRNTHKDKLLKRSRLSNFE